MKTLLSKTARMNTAVAAIAVAVSVAGFAAADANAGNLRGERPSQPPQTVGGYAVNQGGGSGPGPVARDPEHCNNVASCNLLIAYCIGHDGTWTGRGSDPQGRPSAGTCTY